MSTASRDPHKSRLFSGSNQPLNFRELRRRAVSRVQHKINNGEWTERALARVCRLSQPCVHNVLKGARGGSLEVLDRICRAAQVELRDLIEE